MNKNVSINQDFLDDIKGIINNARLTITSKTTFPIGKMMNFIDSHVETYHEYGLSIFVKKRNIF